MGRGRNGIKIDFEKQRFKRFAMKHFIRPQWGVSKDQKGLICIFEL